MTPLDPAALALHYTRFRVNERILLTGHSHQAWPDVAEAGALEAFRDAAEHIDDKWGRAFEKAARVRVGFARLLGVDSLDIALDASTHALLVRLLSALDLRHRPRIVSTDGEFHSVRRQLARLAEEGVEVVLVPSVPAATVGERVAAVVDGRTAAVIVSAVFFDSGQIAGGLAAAALAAQRHGAAMVVDTYHALGALPFELPAQGLDGAYALGGGYKYCQLGEGCCFLRVPAGCVARPVITGWFADFAGLGRAAAGPVGYGPRGHERFAGATYDPTSHYRAARVLDFFDAQGLTPERLRDSSQRQLTRFDAAVERLGLALGRDRSTPLSSLGAFLAYDTPDAEGLEVALRARGVLCDHRGTKLRFGPAPYVTDDQLDEGVRVVAEVMAARGL